MSTAILNYGILEYTIYKIETKELGIRVLSTVSQNTIIYMTMELCPSINYAKWHDYLLLVSTYQNVS